MTTLMGPVERHLVPPELLDPLGYPLLPGPLPARRTRPDETAHYHARLAARFGRTGLAPFLAAPDLEVVDVLAGRGAAGYVPRRRWAITPGDVVAPEPLAEEALSEYLDVLGQRKLRPAFVAAGDPGPYRRRGFAVTVIADEAVVDLATFDLSRKNRAKVRHAVSSARRFGLTVVPYASWQDEQLAEVSRAWLSTKRGGEFGFTLSRHENVAAQLRDGVTDLWSVLDSSGNVQAWCTWRHYLDGQARVLDVMRRRPGAPNPSMDFLIASSLAHYRDAGVREASLASVPRERGAAAERIYPCRSLRAYKQKFDPKWQPRWLAVPSAWRRPLALAAICGAYCPGGLRRAVVRNG